MEKIEGFYKLADSYCKFISENEITIDDMPVLMGLLMRLYLSALDLPDAEPETIDSVSSDEIKEIRINLEGQIPVFYWEVFDPFVEEAAVCASLAEDLSEIASDLQKGMREFEAGRTGNAVFEWTLGLNGHWGNHAVDALRALHTIRTQ